ncbi:MAG: C39 family peptidase [Armatimonadetes bacterium]|nr:C39 family peptidase [Armatimonadota bacterium]MDE2207289.1 C39 family peptidase [Armatimonadota bacterium]
MQHTIAVIAHRGASSLAPENTLPGIASAIRAKADYVEIDVRETRDGHLIAMHDRTVDRTTSGSGAVADLTLDEITRMDAGSKFCARFAAARVPTLEQCVAKAAGRINLYIDHKAGSATAILAILKRFGMERRTVVWGGRQTLAGWRELDPEIPVMPSVPPDERTGPGLRALQSETGARLFDGSVGDWTVELVDESHALGAAVYMDCLGPDDTPDGWRRALALGADGIQTDHPAALRRMLKRSVVTSASPRACLGSQFVGFSTFRSFVHLREPGVMWLTSPVIHGDCVANLAVASWNADTPPGTWLEVNARAWLGDRWTGYYSMGRWSSDPNMPRSSVDGQRDADGSVATDTLSLTSGSSRWQLRIALHAPPAGQTPTLRYLGLSLCDASAPRDMLPANREAWGKEIAVPSKSQLDWQGASGWCSPTSAAMDMAFWAKRLNRPNMDVPVPQAAAAIFDPIYNGTGNWPFNTAWAGRWRGMRAYVTRFNSVCELEDWTYVGIPVVVSVSYDLLRGKAVDNDPGHLLVCDGFTAAGDIVLNDPAYHAAESATARRVYPREAFIRAWARSHGIVYLIYPTGWHIPPNTHGHWE